MIEVKIADIINGTQALQKLTNASLKAKVAWQVSRLLRAAEEELQGFNEARMQLINKYGDKTEDGELVTDDKGMCQISEENKVTFNNELNELISNKVEINASKLDINDLDSVDFTPSEITVLEPFIINE